MSSLLFALVGSFLTALGARDQLLIASLRARLGPSLILPILALTSAAASAALAAWLGALIASRLSASTAPMLVAIALGLAALELAWSRRGKPLVDPTRSLGAIFIVLLARQITDAPRFLIFALAAWAASPLLAGVGGALGGGAALMLGWAMGDELEKRLPLRALRLVLAALLAVVAVMAGLTARGLIG